MDEAGVEDFIYAEPFVPIRVHMVSGKTIDVARQTQAMPLRRQLLVFRNMNPGGKGYEGYDVIAYSNIERVEQLLVGNRGISKRKPA